MTGLQVAIAVGRGDFDLVAELDVPAGATAVVIGENGSGKTTLLEAVAGLAPLDRGRISVGDTTFDDVVSGRRLPARQRRCGMVFQDLRLFPALDAAANVAFGLAARGVHRRTARQLAVSALDELGAAHLATREVHGLSGGEAQRVALARALVIEPRVLLLDEPLAALDVSARADIRTLLRRVLPRVDGPRLVVTHDSFEAMALADHLVVLDRGRVVQQGPTDTVRQRPQTRFVADLVGLNMLRGALRREGSSQRVEGSDGVLSVATDDLAEGSSVLAVFAPNAVTLSAQRPAGSARNVMPAKVQEVVNAGGRVRIRLDSRPPMSVDVTPASVAELNLAPGATVWASVKATEIRVEPV